MKKIIPYILCFIVVLSVATYFFTKSEPEEANITKDDTEETLMEIEKQYKPKEVLILFHDDAKDDDINTIIKEIDGEILDSMADIKNYQVRINSAETTEELLEVIEKLNENPLVLMADLNEIAATIQNNPSLEETAETGSAFEQALNIYNKEVNIYYSTDKSYMFLYPSSWTKVNDKLISDPSEKKGIVYNNEYLKQEFFEQKVDVYLKKDEEKGFTLDGLIDTYERDGLTVTRYGVTKDGKAHYKGFIQAGDRFFVFQPNENVSIDEFSLILDSFLLNH